MTKKKRKIFLKCWESQLEASIKHSHNDESMSDSVASVEGGRRRVWRVNRFLFFVPGFDITYLDYLHSKFQIANVLLSLWGMCFCSKRFRPSHVDLHTIKRGLRSVSVCNRVSTLQFHAVGCQAEINNYIFLNIVQKRRKKMPNSKLWNISFKKLHFFF